MGPLFHPVKGDAHGHRTLRMMRRQLGSVDRVKRAQQIQLPVVLRCRVAKNCHLNRHRNPDNLAQHPKLFSNYFGRLWPARGNLAIFRLGQQSRELGIMDFSRRLTGHLVRLIVTIVDCQHRHQRG